MRFEVKIKKLNDVSGDLGTANSNIRKVASKIGGTASRMPLDHEAYRIIRDSLIKVEEKLNGYNGTVAEMSSIISQIKELYDGTEQGILDEYNLTSHSFWRDDVLPALVITYAPPGTKLLILKMIPGHDSGPSTGLDPHFDIDLKKNDDGSTHLDLNYGLMDEVTVDELHFGAYHKKTTKSILSGHYGMDLDLKMRNKDGDLAPNLDIANLEIDSKLYEARDTSRSNFYEQEIIFGLGITQITGSGNIERGENGTKVKFKGEGETSTVKVERTAKYGTDDDNYYDKESLNIGHGEGSFDYDSTREKGKKLKYEGEVDVADISAEIGFNKDGKHGDVGFDVSVLGIDGSSEDDDPKSSIPLKIGEDSISADHKFKGKYVNVGIHGNYESDEPFADTIFRNTVDYLSTRPSEEGNADKIRRML